MNDRAISVDESIFDVCTTHPEVVDIMAGLGFDEITRPGRLATVGRFMTLAKGCRHKGITLDAVVDALRQSGFEVEGRGVRGAGVVASACEGKPRGRSVAKSPEERMRLLQDLLERLGSGEVVEDVQEDFRRNFKDVSGGEIAAAEQALIRGGVPVREVQRLCDVHATLFEGAVSCAGHKGNPEDAPGHPVRVLRDENERIQAFVDARVRPHAQAVRALFEADPQGSDASLARELSEDVRDFGQVFSHYRRKEELIFPHLERHGVDGPSKVMWGKDDEVRDFVSVARSLVEVALGEPSARNLRAVATELADAADQAEAMVSKEENVLMPIALETLTATEWTQIADESGEEGYCFIDEPVSWKANPLDLANDQLRAMSASVEAGVAEGAEASNGRFAGGRVHLSTGSFAPDELEAVFAAIPLDITFVDKDDKTCFFSHGDGRFFPRPKSCLGRDVYDCHPPKSQAMVHRVLDDFRSGERDSFDFWIHRGDNFLYIRYFAVRDGEGSYLGALEVTQDIAPIQRLGGENRRGADERRAAPRS